MEGLRAQTLLKTTKCLAVLIGKRPKDFGHCFKDNLVAQGRGYLTGLNSVISRIIIWSQKLNFSSLPFYLALCKNTQRRLKCAIYNLFSNHVKFFLDGTKNSPYLYFSAHQIERHRSGLSKAEARLARTVELDFNFSRPVPTSQVSLSLKEIDISMKQFQNRILVMVYQIRVKMS